MKVYEISCWVILHKIRGKNKRKIDNCHVLRSPVPPPTPSLKEKLKIKKLYESKHASKVTSSIVSKNKNPPSLFFLFQGHFLF